MLGGITLIPPPPPPDSRRNELPPRNPAPPGEPDIDDRAPKLRPIPPAIGERLNEVRDGLIEAIGRDRNESEDPPPMRAGMNPSVMPP
jgi:hypothetical protein